MTYPGGKGASGVVHQIINQQPPHSLYVEPFLGSGAVLRAKRSALRSIGIDLDPLTIAAFGDVRSTGLSILHANALDFLSQVPLPPDALVYCDPPYPIAARSQARPIYSCEFTDADHRRLLDQITRLDCMVQISSYANPLYEKALRAWRLHTFQSMTRRGPRTEHLWMNYPQPQALHTYSLIGDDFRERERIARKVRRWRARIAALPGLERLALMSELSAELATNGDAAGIASPGEAQGHAPPQVAVLFAHARTPYRWIEGVEVYDKARDARTWTGGCPLVAHPPCAQWGRLRGLAATNTEEKELGLWAVTLTRRFGGVLEHPAGSSLWPAAGIEPPGAVDQHGGWTLTVDQLIWGHPAQKHTWLYICGCRPEAIPPLPPPGNQPTRCITSSRSTFHRLPEMSKHGRELTPPALALWLVELARRCRPAATPLPTCPVLTAL